MKRKMTKLSRKLLLSFSGAAVGIVMAVTLVGSVFAMAFDRETMIGAMYLSQAVILALIIAAFYRIVDRLIVARVRKLNDAMTKVAAGDYDITVPVDKNDELSRLTESFNRMTTELKANAFLSRDFARYVSHEFKTPLCVIRNYAELTQEGASPDEAARNMEIIIAEVDRLTGLSKDILELCRLDSTTIVEKKDRFSPAAQIRSVLLDLQLLWDEKQIEMVPELEAFTITSNEALLFRVWQNLIGNAVKFTEQGGRVSVRLKRNGEEFVCEVADNGCGITDQDKEHIFTPFYSGHSSHNREGSGLGLSLSKKIVEKLGGTITFESVPGKGTVFTVRLPC